MSSNHHHHFRSLSAQAHQLQPQHQQAHQQQQQHELHTQVRLQPNGHISTHANANAAAGNNATTTIQSQSQMGSSIIRVYSDSQQSLDRLFNPQDVATSVPLRKRNLPQSFFKPNSQSQGVFPRSNNLHGRSISSVDSSSGYTHNHIKTAHIRTHSNLTPMMDLLEIASTHSSANNLNEAQAVMNNNNGNPIGQPSQTFSAAAPQLEQQASFSNNNNDMSSSTEHLVSTTTDQLVTPPVPYPRTGHSTIIGQQDANQAAPAQNNNNSSTSRSTMMVNGHQSIQPVGPTVYHGRSFSLDQRNANVNSMRSIGSQYGLGKHPMNAGSVTNVAHSRTHSTLEPMLEVTNDIPMNELYHNHADTAHHYPPVTTTNNQTILFGDRNGNSANGTDAALHNNNNQSTSNLNNEPIANGSTNSSISNVSYCYSYSSGFGSDEIPVIPQSYQLQYNADVNNVTMEAKPQQQMQTQGAGLNSYFAPTNDHMQQQQINYVQSTTQQSAGEPGDGYMVDYNEF